jgi:hypothetical protein
MYSEARDQLIRVLPLVANGGFWVPRTVLSGSGQTRRLKSDSVANLSLRSARRRTRRSPASAPHDPWSLTHHPSGASRRGNMRTVPPGDFMTRSSFTPSRLRR